MTKVHTLVEEDKRLAWRRTVVLCELMGPPRDQIASRSGGIERDPFRHGARYLTWITNPLRGTMYCTAP